jgi:hypothetical protein
MQLSLSKMESLVAEPCVKRLKKRLTEIDKLMLKIRRKRWWARQWIQGRNNNGGSTFIQRRIRGGGLRGHSPPHGSYFC